MEIQTPAPILKKFSTHNPHLSKEGFGADLTPAPSWAWGPKTIKSEGNIFNMLSRLQINPGSAGYLS